MQKPVRMWTEGLETKEVFTNSDGGLKGGIGENSLPPVFLLHFCLSTIEVL